MNKKYEVVLLFVSIAVIMVFCVIAIQMIEIVYVHGSAIEDKQPTLNEKLLERAKEWNIQKAINETLETAERFEK